MGDGLRRSERRTVYGGRTGRCEGTRLRVDERADDVVAAASRLALRTRNMVLLMIAMDIAWLGLSSSCRVALCRQLTEAGGNDGRGLNRQLFGNTGPFPAGAMSARALFPFLGATTFNRHFRGTNT